MTLPRQLILENLKSADEYKTADEIYSTIHANYPGIGLATIYRTLNLLEELKVINKLNIGDGKARYELGKQDEDIPHYHQLICSECSKIIKYDDFSEEEKNIMHTEEAKLGERFGFRIDRHVVQYYGLCSECVAKKRNC